MIVHLSICRSSNYSALNRQTAQNQQTKSGTMHELAFVNYCLMLEGGEYKCEQDTMRTEN